LSEVIAAIWRNMPGPTELGKVEHYKESPCIKCTVDGINPF